MDWKRMPEGKEKYAAYLCSREWSVLKEAVKERSGGVCERCTVNKMDHVHHLTYARKYGEQLNDLQACCKHCHEFIHGKSDVDPADSRPVVIPWCKRTVKSFYLAGKITGTDWRDQIVDGWSDPSSNAFQLQCEDGSGIWDEVDAGTTVCGVRLLYLGPWWRDVFGGHGSPLGNTGPHAYGDLDLTDEYSMREYASNRTWVARNVSRAVSLCDMLFAWIDSTDCYGTLFEIGYAKALNKVVVVGIAETFKAQAGDMWLAFEGCYCVHASSPINAWNEFWDLVAFEDEPTLHVGCGPTAGPVVDALCESLREADGPDFQNIYDAALAVAEMTNRGTVPLATAISILKAEAADGPHS